MTLTAHLLLMQRLRICGTLPLLAVCALTGWTGQTCQTSILIFGLGVEQNNISNEGKALQFYCIEYFKNYVLGLPTQRGTMNSDVLQNNKSELITHKLTFMLVGMTTTIVTTIKLHRQEGHFVIYCNTTFIM